MIKKEILGNDKGHILIKANEPMRIEIMKGNGGFVLYAYKGTRIQIPQEPTLFHDSEYRD